MTDLPDPADQAAPNGDPDLAALVRPTAASPAPATPPAADQAGAVGKPPTAETAATAEESTPGGDPDLAALVRPTADAPAPAAPPADTGPSGATEPLPPPAATEPTAELPTPDPGVPTEPAGPAVDSPTDVIDLPDATPAEVPVAAVVGHVPAADEPPAARHRRRSLALRFAASFVFGVALVVGIGAGALYAWGLQYDGRILPGVQVGSTDLSGLTREQAQAALARAYGSLGNGKIVLNGPDGQTAISYADVARGPDTAAILDAALAAGRVGEPLADLIGAPQAALHGVTVGSAVTYDRSKLAATVDRIAASVDQTPVDATISTTGGAISATPAKDGRAVDKAALLQSLSQQLDSLDAPSEIKLDVPVGVVHPTVATATVDAAKAAADRMVADLVLARGSDKWTIKASQLRPLVTFSAPGDGSVTPVFDQSGLDPLVKQLAKQINQSAKEAGLKLAGNHVVAVGTSREGRTLDVAATTAAIVAQMAARQTGAATESMAPVVKAVDPKLSSALADSVAGKMKVISSYSVFYWVIVNNHWGGNIEAPATKINGTVVAPGQIFDFWKVVGDLHLLPGEGPGNAIEGGKITVTGAFGGGICTTSTTLFNAAFRAGMIPLARQNHNEFISRYPPGLDATVWIVGNSKQTMSFKNDTPYPILIQRIVTNAGGKRWLTFKIWSVPNGRTAKVSNLVIQPGARAFDTVVRDPTKPVGYSFRNNAPVDGAQVWVTVSIYDHGKLHWSKRYYSNYPAVNGVLVVGSKGGA